MEATMIDGKAIGILCFPFVTLVAFIAIFTKWRIAGAVGFWIVIVIAMAAWSLQQGWRVRREIRGKIEKEGAKVIKVNSRYLRLGPYSRWNTSRSQHVYRVIVQEATGRKRIVWARWGRRWIWNLDTLELKWVDEGPDRS